MTKPAIFALNAALLFAVAASVHAAPPPQAVREIDQLIGALGASGCEFQRNGSWHPAAQAQQHLRRKYDWLRERDMVATAEQFIERAGTKSSLSGRVYQVRCAGRPAVPSAAWLGAKLRELRSAPAPVR
ncbi:DUF5329 domain-containing protein [Montanilutibacter psychrotolerans]|uniref:DUF5329 domain-containing protein n=1 Tax=Montanilutibacter psychrotolerans TaxID=1327343 RepID=A0A3M8SX45_9GAMM|nr:DUF5329 domain-containing protein [Lysobacter psychrotolerans]RNF85255.1 hypothetical protein EER27_05670 [Lysobacter psychrotolerans]